MQGIGLPHQFINLIMLTTKIVSYKFNVNGVYTKVMPAMRGIRQGGPLSPILFVIMMKYLNRLLCKMQMEPAFKYHSKCKALGLTHIAFADDVLIFSRGDTATVGWFLEC